MKSQPSIKCENSTVIRISLMQIVIRDQFLKLILVWWEFLVILAGFLNKEIAEVAVQLDCIVHMAEIVKFRHCTSSLFWMELISINRVVYSFININELFSISIEINCKNPEHFFQFRASFPSAWWYSIVVLVEENFTVFVGINVKIRVSKKSWSWNIIVLK